MTTLAGKITGGIIGFGVIALAAKKIKDNIVERRKELKAFNHGKPVANDDNSFWRRKGLLAGDINSVRKYAGSV